MSARFDAPLSRDRRVSHDDPVGAPVRGEPGAAAGAACAVDSVDVNPAKLEIETAGVVSV
jgi:hypothetical protein